MTAASPDIPKVPAVACGGFGVRAVARIVDMIASFVAAMAGYFFAGILFSILEKLGAVGDWRATVKVGGCLSGVLALAASLVCMTIAEAVAGTSLGKALFGYRIVSLSTLRPCSPKQALIRSAAFFVDSMIFGLVAHLAMRKTPLSQRLGDTWADTVVVKGVVLDASAKRPALMVLAGIALALGTRAAFSIADIALKALAAP